MTDALDEFLAGAAARPFSWSDFNCGFWLADWLVALGRTDPAMHLRAVATRRAALRTIARAGGMEAVVKACAERAGLAETRTPVRGDVGVITVAISENGAWAGVGAICTGPRWAALGQLGLVVIPAAPLLAWRV